MDMLDEHPFTMSWTVRYKDHSIEKSIWVGFLSLVRNLSRHDSTIFEQLVEISPKIAEH